MKLVIKFSRKYLSSDLERSSEVPDMENNSLGLTDSQFDGSNMDRAERQHRATGFSLPEVENYSAWTSSSIALEENSANWQALLAVPIIICGITGNVLVCIAVKTDKRLRNVTNYFLVSLAFADMCVSVIVMPCCALQEFFGYWPLGFVICDLWQFCDVMLCTSSIMHMCIISIDRYVGIRTPLVTRNRSPRVVAFKIGLVWLISLLISSSVILLAIFCPTEIMDATQQQCAIFNREFLIYGSLSAFFAPLLIMLVTYSLSMSLLSRQARRLFNSASSALEADKSKCGGISDLGLRRSRSLVASSRKRDVKNRSAFENEGYNAVDASCSIRSLEIENDGKSNADVQGTAVGCFPNKIYRKKTSLGNHFKSVSGTSEPGRPILGLARKRSGQQYLPINTSDASLVDQSASAEIPITNKKSFQKKPLIREEGSVGVASSSNWRTRLRKQNQQTIVDQSDVGNSVFKHIGSIAHSLHNLTSNLSTPVSTKNHSGDPPQPEDHSSSTAPGNAKFKALVQKHSATLRVAGMLIAKRDNQKQAALNSVKTERKAVRVLGAMFAIFVVCWAPFFSANLAMGLCQDCDIDSLLFRAFLWLGYISSTLNPIVYTIFNKNFRNTFADLLTCKQRRRRRNSPSPNQCPNMNPLTRVPEAKNSNE